MPEYPAALDSTAPDSGRDDYREAIVDANRLSRPIAAARAPSRRRPSGLYGPDPRLPPFRVSRRLWPLGRRARPLPALLAAVARDPLLAASAPPILYLPPGAELRRQPLRDALGRAVGDRLNDSVLDKAHRSAASSWTQAGHPEGWARKIRCAADRGGVHTLPRPRGGVSRRGAVLLGMVPAAQLRPAARGRALDAVADGPVPVN